MTTTRRQPVPGRQKPRGAFAAGAGALLFVACFPKSPRDAQAEPKSAQKTGAGSASAAAGPVVRPDHPLPPDEAKAYALALINRDRASQGLGKVTWDETAERSAVRHARDMAAHGVTAHWGTDGSTPEIRYTEAGGTHLTTENVGCLADEKSRTVRPAGPYEPTAIEEFEDRFFNEKPPMDGHRRNILGPRHTRVGIGFAGVEGFPVVCVVHEFIDDYGTYSPLPRHVKQGDTLAIHGTVRAPAVFGGVGIGFEEAAKPRTPRDLGKTGGYAMPAPFVSYFPKGFVTPLPVAVDGASFALDLPAGREKGPGEYVITIFARFPGEKALVPVSMRTVGVR